MHRMVVILVLCLTGCATDPFREMSPASLSATFCAVAKPILWSPKDTRLTKEQADTHNRMGKELCGWGPKKKG